MRIAFITGNYPSPSRPQTGTFVRQFAWALARQDHVVAVVNPASWFDLRYGPLPPLRSREDAGEGAGVDVHRPRYLSCSSRNLGWTHTGRWTQRMMNAAAVRAIARLAPQPDCIYGHFLYHAGRAAVVAGQRLGLPAFVGVGEGTFWTVDAFGFERARSDFAPAAGFLAVASHIRDGLVARVDVPADKIRVEPNGVDPRLFRPLNRAEARRRLRLGPERFLVLFVGTFDHLKGGVELVEAVNGLAAVDLAMLGHGVRVFQSPHLVFQGTVPHDEIPVWMSAADVFVLPTREEGSCNAVVEAMACACPIITSDGRYMDDLVDDAVAIRVAPTDVAAIRAAIQALRDDPERRRRMAVAAWEHSRRFGLDDRARRVAAWMEARMAARNGTPGGRA